MNPRPFFERLIYTHIKDVFDYMYNLTTRRAGDVFPKSTTFIGHRGLCAHPTIKENTLEAFDQVIGLGAGIEFDLHLSQDRVLMVHHDNNLRRVFGVDAEIAHHTAAALQAIAPIPTLTEVLDRYAERAPFLFIEDKNTPEDGGTQESSKIVEHELKKRNLTQKSAVIALKTEIIDVYRQTTQDLNLGIIYLINPREALCYCEKYSEIGLFGWYMTFPKELEELLQKNRRLFGCGFLNWEGAAYRFAQRGFPFLFSDRLDRVIPKVIG